MSLDTEKIKQMSEKKLKEKLMIYEMKRWQESRGCKNGEFTTIKTMNKYQVYYDDMLQINADGEDGMGVDQLIEPFISLGLAYSKEEVNELIESVDEDGSKRIEFDEFLDIIHNKSKIKTESNKKITNFFKSLANNDFSSAKNNLSHFSFKTVMNILRRENLLKAFNGKEEDKEDGMKILKAYTNYLNENAKNKKFNKKK